MTTSVSVWTPFRHASAPSTPNPNPLLGTPRELTPATVGVVGVVGVALTGVAATRGLAVGFLAVVAVAFGIAALYRPAIAGFAVTAGVPLLSGIKRGFPVPGLRASEALVAFGAVTVLLPAFRHETQRWARLDWLAFAYSVGSVALPLGNLLVRDQPVTVASMSSMFLPIQFFLLYRIVRAALPAEAQRRFALRVLLFGSLIVSFIAAAQQLNLGPARSLVSRFTASEAIDSYSYSVYARATGPFQHWHPLAGYLAVIILLCVALLLDQKQTVMSRRSLAVVLATSIAALMLSVTFVSMFGVLVGSALLGLWAGRLRKALVWSAFAAVIALVIFGSFVATRVHNQYTYQTGQARNSLVPQTVERRVQVWTDQYIPAMNGRWAAGYGPDLPPDVSWTHTESVYVTILLRGGAPLLLVFALSMLAVSRAAREASLDAARRPAARAVMALVAVLWFMQLLYPYFTSSGLPQPFWVLVGVVLAGTSDYAAASSSRQTRQNGPN